MMTYNFFGRLNLAINAHGHRGYRRYFKNEYLRIADTGLVEGAPTITVEVVKEIPERQDGDIVGSDHYKRLFHFSYLVRGIDTNNVVIYFRAHWVDKLYMNAIGVYLQAQVLEPVMYLKLLEENVLFMHAAGVATDDAGCLMPAHGGTGKTTMRMALLGHGYGLLGDDLLFVDVDSQMVHPYPRPLHLFTYNVRNLNGAKVPFKYQVAIYTKNMLRFGLERALRTEFLISTRVHADELFKETPFASSVPYRRLCFLVKDGEPVVDMPITDDVIPQLAMDIMDSADLNDSLYAVIGDEMKVERVKKLEAEVIGELLGQFKQVTYINTRKLDLGDPDDLVKLSRIVEA